MHDPRAPFRRIAIGTDHGGFEMKNRLVAFLESEGHPVIDCGSYHGDPADYPIYAGRVARAISSGLVDAGIILCKSGNGVAMVANRHPGVRAAWAEDEKAAATTREHNNANALVIGSEHLKGDLNETVRAWLNARHEPSSRHGRRVAMIDELDQTHVSALPALRLVQATASPWLASVPVALADSEDFHAFAAHHHLRGATVGRAPLAAEVASNPDRWRPAMLQWDRNRLDTNAVAEALYIGYVRMVADTLEPAYLGTDGDEGIVAVRVPITPDANPGAILDLARRVEDSLDRKNTHLSLPALSPVLSALPQLVEQGHSLLLRGIVSPRAVESVIFAWFNGLHLRMKSGQNIHGQRLILSVPILLMHKAIGGEELFKSAAAILATMRGIAVGPQYHDLAFAGASLPRVAWDCEGADGMAAQLARDLFAPLTIQIHGASFFALPEGSLDGAEHPLRNWLAVTDRSVEPTADLDSLQRKAPLELCERENADGIALADAIRAALQR